MNILIVSLDNSNNAKIGGKHIHQELLMRGWLESGNNVDIVYPKGMLWLIKKVFRKAFQLIKFISPFKYFYYAVSDDKRVIKKIILNELKTKKYNFISVQDVVAALAVKEVFLNQNISIPVILTLHGYFSRESVNYGNFSKIDQEKVYNFAFNIEKEAIEFVKGIVTVDT